MKVLVTTAFALTLLLSASTAFLALQSSSLDGEPHASIVLQPPANKTASVKPRPQPIVKPVAEPVAAVADDTAPAASATANVIETAKAEADSLPEQATEQNATSPSTVKKKQPVKPATSAQETVSAGASGNALLPVESGFGIGVGNLGPIRELPASN